MNYVVFTHGHFGERKVEMCSSMENAQRVAEKWAAELNCKVIIAEVIGTYSRVTEWKPRIPGAQS
jgi:hypothetical protein